MCQHLYGTGHSRQHAVSWRLRRGFERFEGFSEVF